MLKRLTIGNFKPINGTHSLDLKPITVLAGLNSSGKSTVLQSILLLSQTLSNPNPEKTLILNGNIIQLGTFDATHNEQDKSEVIELGFTLTPTRLTARNINRQRSRISRRFSALDEAIKEVSVDAAFRSANSRPGDQSAIEAVRVALQRCAISALFERAVRPSDEQPRLYPPIDYEPATDKFSVSANITSLTQAEQSAFLKGVREEFLVMLPHPDGQNFLLSLSSAQSPDKQQFLTRLYHFLPERLVQRFNLKQRQAQELMYTISIVADSKDLLEFLPPGRKTLAEKVSTHPVTEKLREKLQILSQPRHAVAFNGTTLGELLDWAKKTPLKTRAKSNYIQSIKDLVFAETMSSLYQGNDNDQECGLETVSDDVQAVAIDLAASYTINHFSTMIRYLGPLRADPQAAQGFAPSNEPDDVGFKGEYAAAVYDANKSQSIRWWNPVTSQTQESSLEEALNAWAKHIGVAQRVATREAGASGVAWSVQALANSPERPLQSVGVGVSQVLPILVSGLLAPIGATILIEQPEIVVGDVICLRPGDIVPADGICFESSRLTCNEFIAAGGDDPRPKTSADEGLKDQNANTSYQDPFIVSGSKVLDGKYSNLTSGRSKC